MQICDIVQEAVIKAIPRTKKCKKRQNGCLRRHAKRREAKAKEKKKDIPI